VVGAVLFTVYGWILLRKNLKSTETFLFLIGLLSPPLAAIAEWIFPQEPLSPAIFISTGVVSVGLFFVYYAEVKQGYILKKAHSPLLKNFI
jgi:drug/metabolite transporter (DMT)-like permease